MRTVLQIAPETALERAVALAGAGFVLALDGFDGDSALLEHCGIVKVAVAGRDDEALTALIAGPAERGLELVATGVATADEFTRCRVLGFSHFQGEFFARPSGEGSGGAVASLQALSELAGVRRLLRGARADHRRRRRALARAPAPRQLGLLRAPAQDRHRPVRR